MPFPTFPIAGSRFVSDFRGDFNTIIDAIFSAFIGPSEPVPTRAGLTWVDTSIAPKLLKQRNSTNTGWVIRARIDTDFGGALPLTGGAMEGPINMGGFPILNLPSGSGNAPARYADLAGYSKIDGSIPYTGIPTLPAQDPSTPNQAARKDYVDRATHSGGSYTSQIAMQVAATNPTHLLRKGEFDSAIAAHIHSGAAGMGPRVQGTNIGSGTVPSGMVLHADGTGTAAWAEVMTLSDDVIEYLLETHEPVDWTVKDLAPYLPAQARVAILKLWFMASQQIWMGFTQNFPGGSLRCRSYQSTSAGVQLSAQAGTGMQTLAFVPMVDRKIEMKYDTGWVVGLTKYGSEIQVALIGYL